MKKLEIKINFYCNETQFENEEFQEFLDKVIDGTFETDLFEESGLSFEGISVSYDLSDIEDA